MTWKGPAGPAGTGANRCLICRKRFTEDDAPLYEGQDDAQKAGVPFAGYFCCLDHQKTFRELSREEKLTTVFGTLARGLALLLRKERGDFDEDEAEATLVLSFARDGGHDILLNAHDATTDDSLLDARTLEPLRDHQGLRKCFSRIADRRNYGFRPADKTGTFKKW